ncbi:MAG TPA: tetratricopeptide repeat protein [Planctomycetes bacterium]|nr:tetratricopeptide repeat protein [Planctomycetota bacterium]
MSFGKALRNGLALLPLFLLPASQTQAWQDAVYALIGRDYDAAVKHLDAALAATQGKKGAETRVQRFRFLAANALLASGRYGPATERFEALLKDFPQGRYAALARFGKAAAKERSHSFEPAARIYKEELRRLLDPARRMELAKVYLSFVDRALKRIPKDYRTAIQFLDLTRGLGLPDKDTLSFERRAAALAMEAKDYRQAVQRYQLLYQRIQRREGKKSAGFERLQYAKALIRAGSNLAGARLVLETLLREGQEPKADLHFELGLALEKLRVWNRADEEFSTFVQSYPKDKRAPAALLKAARARAASGRLPEALRALSRLSEGYGDQAPDLIADAAALRGSWLQSMGRYDEAIAAWKSFLSRFPSHPKWREGQKAIINLEYAKALAARDKGKEHFDEAKTLFLSFVQRHPLDGRNPGIYILLGKMEEERKQYDDAKKLYRDCERRFRGTSQASEAAYRYALILETKEFKLAEAAKAYEKVTGRWSWAAKNRLRALRSKTLVVKTERVFRTDEKPVLLVRSRNVKTLRLRLYALDFEDYFRGTMGAKGISSLAIEAIAPDRSIEWKVKDYEDYREFENKIPMPGGKAGAWVVKVDDGEREATSLVVVSDLALIQKVSADEVFGFVENTRTQDPAPGVRVLLSNGKKIVAESKTDARGGCHFALKPGQRGGTWNLLAVGQGGVAFSDQKPLRKGSRARTFVPTSVVYTDRPSYRPGEWIGAKAILRDVQNGSYVVPRDKDYQLSLVDPGSRRLLSKDLSLSEFGTLAARFRLPKNPKLGTWTLQLIRKRDRRFLSSYQVQVLDFQPPKVALEVVLPHSSITRGEPIEGKVRARYFFGGPVRGRKIRVFCNLLEGQKILEGLTDGAGEFRFRFETDPRRPLQDLLVTASIAEEGAFGQKLVKVRDTGYRLSLRIPEGIFLAGESVEATAEATDFEGKPLVRTLEFTLLRLVKVAGRLETRVVTRMETKTLVGRGLAFATFKLGEGGNYRVVVAGKDRFGHRVEARRDIFVSGKEDKVKLRLLARSQHARVGEQVELRIVNRSKARLCLLTTEAGGVLDFEPRVIPTGVTTMRLKIGAKHAPNFAYAVAMVDGNKFHTARKEFTVSVPMNLEMKLSSKLLAPGKNLGIDILVRDSKGRPVEAEFSLAAVDAAVLQQFPDKSPSLYQAFFGLKVRRSTQVWTSSSCTFSFAPPTRRVNLSLSQEEQEKARSKAEPQKWSGTDDFSLGRAPSPANDAPSSPRTGLPGRRRLSRRGGKAFSVKKERKDLEKSNANHFSLGSPKEGNLFQGFFFNDGLDRDFSVRKDAQKLALLAMGQDRGSQQQRAEDPSLVLPSDLSVWRAVIRSDAKGRARIELPLPKRAGKWVLRLRGVDKGSLFGEAKAEVQTRNTLVLRARMPAYLTERDRFEGEIEVHNRGEQEYRGELRFALDGQSERKLALRIKAGSFARVLLDPKVLGLGAEKLEAGTHELKMRVGEESKTQRFVVRPWALLDQVGDAGIFSGSRRVRLQLAGGAHRDKRLVIRISPPSIEVLVRDFLSAGKVAPMELTKDQAAMGLGALALWRQLGGEREDALLARALADQVRSTLASLMSAESGGIFAWIGNRSLGTMGIEPETDLYPWLFLERARKAGFSVDAKLLARVRNRGQAWIRSSNLEHATLAFLAWAEGEGADFARFNQLRRGREQMSAGALGRLVIAALRMRRPGLAKELLSLLGQKIRASLRKHPDGSDLSLAWAYLALEEAGGDPGLRKQGESWAFGRTTANNLSDPLVAALASDFLARRRKKLGEAAAKVQIKVGNGAWSQSLNLREHPRGKLFEVPAKFLGEGEVLLDLRTSGLGKVAWSAQLMGWTQGIPKERVGAAGIKRSYLQAAPIVEGSPLREGFSVMGGGFKPWKNLSDRVEAGRQIYEELEITLPQDKSEEYRYFLVEESLPGGAVVRRDEVQGPFQFVEQRGGKLRFFCQGGSRTKFRFRFPLRGVFSGVYRVLPTRVLGLRGGSVPRFGMPATLKVVKDAKEAVVPRRPTPDELYHLGIRRFDALGREGLRKNPDQLSKVEKPLEACMKRFGREMKPRPFLELAKRLLTVRLLRGEGRPILELFEALKDRSPNFVLGFEDMAAVGDAYFKAGEFERSLYVFQAVCETLFLREVQVAGTLKERGRVQDALGVMGRLFLEFPGLSEIRQAMYSLAQGVNALAEQRKKAPRYDARIGSSMQLKKQARDLCYEFLLRFPDDADADEVCYSLVNIALEAKQWKEALALLQRAIKTYAESTWLDDFLYLEGYARFLQGDFAKAKQVLDRVIHGEFLLGRGRKGPSPNKTLAVFLEAQCFHAEGDPARAVPLYHQVEKDFAEAKEAAAYFETKKLHLPETTVVAPDAEASIQLQTRNLERVEILVYKVDLMRLYLQRRSLSDIGNVRLFGIKPTLQRKVVLEGAKPYLDFEQRVPLDLEAKGAYLVIARSGALKSSGLVLRTRVRVEAQEFPRQGRLRLNLSQDGKRLPGARVKVLGSSSSGLRSGKTDLRGVFVADGLRGKVTALVESEGNYAFYRSKQLFGNPITPSGGRGRAQQFEAAKQTDLLQMNSMQLKLLQEKGGQSLERLFRNKQQGVELRRTK